MAAKEKPPAGDADRKTEKTDNGFDPEITKQITAEILDRLDAMEKLNASMRGEINGMYKKAKREGGVSINLLKHEVRRIRREQKDADREEELEEEFPGGLEKLRDALKGIEDTPLGRAAIAAAEGGADRPRDSLTPGADK